MTIDDRVRVAHKQPEGTDLLPEPDVVGGPASAAPASHLTGSGSAVPFGGPGVSRRWYLRYGIRPYLIVGDALAFGIATVITHPTSPIHLIVLLVNIVVFSFAGLYRSRLNLSLLDDLPAIAGAVLVGAALKIMFVSLLPGVDPPARQVVHAVVLFLAVVIVRGLAYTVVREARRRGRVRHRTLILGAGPIGTQLASLLLERRETGLEPIGFVDANTPTEILPLPVLGGHEQISEIIRQYGVRDLIVAWAATDEPDLVDILRTCDRLDVEVFLVPRLFELHTTSRDSDDIWGIPVVRVRRVAFRSPYWKVKRLIDVVVSAVALLFLAPVLAACAIAVRREGGPGVIFRQVRVGLDGRPFEVLKFRSLKPVDDAESSTNWNIKHDARLGPVGRFLRSTSLDELPQLWNILRGDMSLVGPRPERPHFVEQFSTHIPRYAARHRVPAGLTGWAQANGLRGDTSIEDRARFDNYYIENWSPWLDTKIVLKTVGQVLRRQGG